MVSAGIRMSLCGDGDAVSLVECRGMLEHSGSLDSVQVQAAGVEQLKRE